MLMFIFILLIGFALGWLSMMALSSYEIKKLNSNLAKAEDVVDTLYHQIEVMFEGR